MCSWMPFPAIPYTRAWTAIATSTPWTPRRRRISSIPTNGSPPRKPVRERSPRASDVLTVVLRTAFGGEGSPRPPLPLAQAVRRQGDGHRVVQGCDPAGSQALAPHAGAQGGAGDGSVGSRVAAFQDQGLQEFLHPGLGLQEGP